MRPDPRPITAEEYRTLVEQAPMIIWRADTTGACDWFNERWLAFRGRTMREEVGQGWVEGVHPDDVDRCVRTYLDAFARRETFEMEYRLLRHDGVYRWIFDRGCPSFAADGAFTGYIGSCVDVTDRVEAQAALAARDAEERRRLEALLPICASCKSVRDDAGYWGDVQRYLTSRGTALTHTFCPTCLDTLYAE